ncbi:MAG: fibronectin type III domain-containing protein, partial [Verrucomicrobia bacterium]|nr:fibronectin type III domain-containing protein [Verrucomicrobiota bacterium]
IVEAGLVGGQKLIYSGKTLIEVGPEIASADIHYASDKITVDVRGNGRISMPAGSEKTLVLNGKTLSGGKKGWWWKRRWEVELASPGPLELSVPTLSNDLEVVSKATIGVPGRGNRTEHPVVVTWKTSLPADASIEYSPAGSEDWKRNMKPDAVTAQRLVLSPLSPGTTYRIRIRSATEDGRIGKTQLTYLCREAKP